ncbi:hypothetical protein EGW08_016302 [Elysia chlorotica]|uniref:G-protein coupled receptors family 1 profile domain-containing protein n=1 Tax=Elysia chlorotica TaxID=188477 RepID=A0A433T303_ELYCH|nr:hypothetical protein EGW08_016302 [Elysia chlorotica]
MANEEEDNNGNGANTLLIVIISIVCINILMIYEIVVAARKRAYGSSRAKHLILISQGIGDICIGLFPLNLRLQAMLDNPPMEDIACWQRILANTYMFHLMPFIHATGIIVLIAESYIFWRRGGVKSSSFPDRRWYSLRYLLAGTLPWGLGVLIVIPLVIVGFDLELCSVQNYPALRLQSFYFVSIVLPGALAIISAVVYSLSSVGKSTKTSLSISSSPCLYDNDLPTYSDALQASTYSQKIPMDKADISDELYVSNAKLQVYDYRTSCKECGRGLIDSTLQELGGQISHNSVEDVKSTIIWEKRSRLAAAALFCVCSIPSAILDIMFLSSSSEDAWPVSVKVTSGIETMYRLHVLRSLISPLVWINEYS